MNNVVRLADYVRSSGEGANTATPASNAPTSGGSSWLQTDRFTETGELHPGVIRRLDPDTALSRFLTLADQTIEQLDLSEARLAEGDLLGADDALRLSKSILSELTMYRDLGDSVGLVIMKCFGIVATVAVVADAIGMPRAIKSALQRICGAPFMNFEEACVVVDVLEQAAGQVDVPGYAELANELIGDATH